MKDPRNKKIAEILAWLLGYAEAKDRRTDLELACRGDADLRKEIEKLLRLKLLGGKSSFLDTACLGDRRLKNKVEAWLRISIARRMRADPRRNWLLIPADLARPPEGQADPDTAVPRGRPDSIDPPDPAVPWKKLKDHDPRTYEVALYLFAGMAAAEIAEALDADVRTIEGEASAAKALLLRFLQGWEEPKPGDRVHFFHSGPVGPAQEN
jgi:hypothetical protein